MSVRARCRPCWCETLISAPALLSSCHLHRSRRPTETASSPCEFKRCWPVTALADPQLPCQIRGAKSIQYQWPVTCGHYSQASPAEPWTCLCSIQLASRLHRNSGAPCSPRRLTLLARAASVLPVFGEGLCDFQGCRHFAALYILRYPLFSLAQLVSLQAPASAKLLHLRVAPATERYIGAESGQASPNTTKDTNAVRAAESKVTLERPRVEQP